MRYFCEKQKHVQTLNFLLVKNIGKDLSDLKIITKYHFNYKRPLFIELQADENSTKVPISSINFSNKVPISESYQENLTLPET